MKQHAQEISRWTLAATFVSLLLLLIPAVGSAASLSDRFRVRDVFDSITKRLCEAQESHGNRVRLIDPSRCASTLTLMKTVISDEGGTASTADFQAKIDGANVPWGVAQTVSAGTHTASETALAGYTASDWGGDCEEDGTITLAAGENKTCTIENDDQPASLIVKKIVIRDNGGNAATTTFSFQVNDSALLAFEADGQNDFTLDTGTYTITESAASGYTTTYDNCTNVAIANGGSATCTITNNDVAPAAGHLIVDKVTQPGGSSTEFTINASGTGTITGGGAGTTTDATSKNYEVEAGTYSVAEVELAGWMIVSNMCTNVVVDAGETETCVITNAKLPTLTVVKVVVNNNGGTKQISDFPLFIDGSPVASWATTTVATGTRAVSETTDAGYARTFSDDCDSNGNVTLVAGDVKKCTITNDDQQGTLTVKKIIIRDDGNDAATTTFSFQVNDGTPMFFDEDGMVDVPLNAGTYTINEGAHDGFTTTTDNCDNVVLANGGTATCTITNNDNPPSPSPGSVVISEIMYDPAGADDNHEWIEIRNETGGPVDLTDWKFFEDNTNHTLALAFGVIIIPDGGFAVISEDAAQFQFDFPNFATTLFDSSFELLNSSETIAIKNAGGTVVDEVTYLSDQGASNDGNSLQKTAGVWVAAAPTPGS